MKRKNFLTTILQGGIGMNTLSAFKNFTAGLEEQEQLMPVLFIGQGSPKNGIEDNGFSER